MEDKSILLVEDGLDIIEVQRSLEKLNLKHQLTTVHNGVEALKVLWDGFKTKNKLPDVILLDINMPRMNGIEFLKEVRADSILKKIKIFVMTTSGEEYDRKITEELGVSGYIIKPLNFNNNDKRVSSMDNFMNFYLTKILN